MAPHSPDSHRVWHGRARSNARSSCGQNSIVYALIAIATLTALYAQAFFRTRLFIYGSYDTAYYLQAFSNLAHLRNPTSTLNEFFASPTPINVFMGHHFQYSALLFAPLFLLSHSPIAIALYVIPAIYIAFLLYFWCKLFAAPKDCLPGSLGLAILLWAPNSGLFASEFYFDKFVIPWVVASFFFYLRRQFGRLLFTLVLTTGFKEYFALFAAAACFLYWYESGSRKAMIAATAFILYTVVVMAFVMPYFFEGDSLVLHTLGGLGQTPSDRLRAAFRNLYSREAGVYVMMVLRPFLFLPILKPGLGLLSVPVLALNVLAGTVDKPYRTALPHAVLAVLFVCAFHRLRQRLQARLKGKRTSLILAVIALAALPVPALRDTLARIRADGQLYLSAPRYQRELEEVFATITPNDVLSVSPKLSPYVVTNEAYVFPKPFGDPTIGEHVSLIVISKHHPSYLDNSGGDPELFRRQVAQVAAQYRFERAIETNDVLVMRRMQTAGGDPAR